MEIIEENIHMLKKGKNFLIERAQVSRKIKK